MQERNKLIVQEYMAGEVTLQQLADRYSITKQRIHQIVARTPGTNMFERWARKKLLVQGLSVTEAMTVTGYSERYCRFLGAGAARPRVKTGPPATGQMYEEWVAEELVRRGYKTELMAFHSPFDILVNGKTRIDVKGRQYADLSSSGIRNQWVFNLGARKYDDRCDFLVCVMGSHLGVLIIPSLLANNLGSVSFRHPKHKDGQRQNKWMPYLDAWQIIGA